MKAEAELRKLKIFTDKKENARGVAVCAPCARRS